MADYEQINYRVDDGVLTLTLSRPERLNAFTTTMRDEMLDAFDRSDTDDDVRVVVVTGAGRGFCAGADLAAGGETFDYRVRGGSAEDAPRDGGGQVALRIYSSLKPVIAAINGPAVGVGITMTLPMDIRMVSDGAKIGFVFTRRGITPEATSSWFLPRLVGPSLAAEWLYSGRVFGADEALAGGLARSVHRPDELLPAAYALAREIADHAAPVSVAVSRRLLWRMLATESPYDAHVADSRAIHKRGQSADVREGIEAFLDKRPARFPDRVSRDLPDVFSDPQPQWASDLPR